METCNIKINRSIENCPFCQQIPTIVEHELYTENNDSYYQYDVECSCGTTTKLCDCVNEAIEEWNKCNFD